jgi:hypothetical protein
MDYDHAAVYAQKMLAAFENINAASTFAYQNGRDDANPFDDMMTFVELLTAAENEEDARRAFVRICENDIEMPAKPWTDFNDDALFIACANLLDELKEDA